MRNVINDITLPMPSIITMDYNSPITLDRIHSPNLFLSIPTESALRKSDANTNGKLFSA